MFAVEFIVESVLPERKEFDTRYQAMDYADSLDQHARVLNRCVFNGQNWELPLYGYH